MRTLRELLHMHGFSVPDSNGPSTREETIRSPEQEHLPLTQADHKGPLLVLNHRAFAANRLEEAENGSLRADGH